MQVRVRDNGLGGICSIASPRPARAMDDAAAQVMSQPGYPDQNLRQPSVAPARAKIIFDLWLMSVGPFFEAVGAAIFQRNIHLTVLLDLVKVVLLLKPVAQLPSAKCTSELSF